MLFEGVTDPDGFRERSVRLKAPIPFVELPRKISDDRDALI